MLYKGDTLYLNWLEDGIAELVFDAPGSVNKLDTATVASLGQALDVLEKQTELKGLLLRSNKAAFIVGADITEFLSLFLVPEEQLSQWLHFANSVFNRPAGNQAGHYAGLWRLRPYAAHAGRRQRAGDHCRG